MPHITFEPNIIEQCRLLTVGYVEYWIWDLGFGTKTQITLPYLSIFIVIKRKKFYFSFVSSLIFDQFSSLIVFIVLTNSCSFSPKSFLCNSTLSSATSSFNFKSKKQKALKIQPIFEKILLKAIIKNLLFGYSAVL